MRRPRLLAVGDGLSPTGYARATQRVLGRLAGEFDVTLLALDGPGPAAAAPFAIRPNALLGDRWGREQLPPLLGELEPDVVLLHRNTGFHALHRDTLAAYRAGRPGACVVAACPGDSPALLPRALDHVDLLVLYTRHGLETARDAFRGAGVESPATAVIGLGVDAGRFGPVDAVEARRALFPREPGIEDAFLVLNANRNERRKRIDLTLRGFALFARDRPRARLVLHMGMGDLGWDVRALAAELGIAERVLTTTDSPDHPCFPDDRLNLVYNACDVGVNTSAAEGFGLVPFEHAATGAAQVVPDHGASAELWEGSAVLAPGDAEGVAAALGKLHDDGALRTVVAERCRALASSPELGWDAVGGKWRDALAGLVRERRGVPAGR